MKVSEMKISDKINVIAAACNLIGMTAEEFAYIWWDIGMKLRYIEFKKMSKEEVEDMVDNLGEVL